MTEPAEAPAPDLLGPLSLSVPLPQFSQPPVSQLDPDLPGTPPPTTDPEEDSPRPAPVSPIPSTTRGGTPTRTSSRGGAEQRDNVAGLLVGLLSIFVGLLAWGVSKRGWTLRPPDDDELDDVAEPTARILARHVDVAALSPDLGDSVQIAAAAFEYVRSDPLSRGLYVVNDIPSQPEQESP